MVAALKQGAKEESAEGKSKKQTSNIEGPTSSTNDPPSPKLRRGRRMRNDKSDDDPFSLPARESFRGFLL
jgi:hypothetical protein